MSTVITPRAHALSVNERCSVEVSITWVCIESTQGSHCHINIRHHVRSEVKSPMHPLLATINCLSTLPIDDQALDVANSRAANIS